MKRSTKYPLVSNPESNLGSYQRITSADAGWTHLNCEARMIKKGEVWEGYTGDDEYGFILLSGNYTATTSKGTWSTTNGRKNVFAGIAHTLFLPAHTSYSIKADSDELDLAAGWCKSTADSSAKFKTPEEVAIEIRGGDNATRQINSLIEPGFGNSQLVAVEVYTPSGNWSSFPAHKHDERRIANDGELIEANLEEFYFYKIANEKGYAIQQVYTTDGTLDEMMKLRNNDIVMVPRGYHPVAAAHGYDCYYLNFLAGSDQSLANMPDPDHEWIFKSWQGKDARIPMVTAEMNNA